MKLSLFTALFGFSMITSTAQAAFVEKDLFNVYKRCVLEQLSPLPEFFFGPGDYREYLDIVVDQPTVGRDKIFFSRGEMNDTTEKRVTFRLDINYGQIYAQALMRDPEAIVIDTMKRNEIVSFRIPYYKYDKNDSTKEIYNLKLQVFNHLPQQERIRDLKHKKAILRPDGSPMIFDVPTYKECLKSYITSKTNAH